MVGNIVDVGWATIKSGCLPITGNYPSPPHLKGERCSQTMSNLGHAALLRRCELNESAELTQERPLVNLLF